MSAGSLRDRVAEVIRAEGLTDDGGTPHGWRCEHPDRYPGYCTCVTDITNAALAEVRAWLGSPEARGVVETAILGRTATTGAPTALAALIDQTKEAP